MKNLETNDYYSRDRKWPSFFPITVGAKILDIGCGKGVLGSYLKNSYSAKVTGLEIFPEYASEASGHLDEVICGNFEDIDLSAHKGIYDYVIFSDSLEHLLEPKAALLKARTLLKDSGELLIAIPNIRNFRVTFPLVVFGNFEYQDEGLLDRTHLRFFTLSSISNMLASCGFRVHSVEMELPKSSKVGLINLLTFSLFRESLTSHFYIRATK
ncbi:class I SAM-dependent methyltransferase [Gammaproteobacteria bacterium]|jgi:2-polyprenyl-3-methyl-5-hydroxy-6-metoxy-1,4-benzoquinol methylase|nr:class I SAM-dependent methyltransferase [Gammaproteobacteria bacterium]